MIYLVACVSQKGAVAAPARDIYCSDWWNKARAYVEATGEPWFILSARHGLIQPGRVIAPYDRTLARMGVADRYVWGSQVATAIKRELPPGEPLTFLAGEAYRRPILASPLPGRAIFIPMEGLGIGEQKAWLVRETARLIG